MRFTAVQDVMEPQTEASCSQSLGPNLCILAVNAFRAPRPLRHELLVERTAYDASGIPIEYARDLFRGDRTRVLVESSLATTRLQT